VWPICTPEGVRVAGALFLDAVTLVWLVMLATGVVMYLSKQRANGKAPSRGECENARKKTTEGVGCESRWLRRQDCAFLDTNTLHIAKMVEL